VSGSSIHQMSGTSVFWRQGTRIMRVPRRAEFLPNPMSRYELSRICTKCDCARWICLAVSRSATRIGLP
jgi:hypothetical protein